MGKTFCWKCATRHDSSTGKFCTVKTSDKEEFHDFRDHLVDDDDHTPLEGVELPGSSKSSDVDVVQLAQQMDSIETLLLGSLLSLVRV